MRWKLSWLMALVPLAGCGGGGGGSAPPPPPANRAPAFTSGTTASAPENSGGTVYQAIATDPDNDPLVFSLGSGGDSVRFAITSAGALRFAAPPDFEQPADSNRDNVYEVQIVVSDGRLSSTISVSVTVTNAAADGFTVRRVGSGFAQPIFLAGVPDNSGRVFVLERAGRIRILNPSTGAIGATPFLDVTGQISTDGERGLLGFAAAPDFATSGTFYVQLTNPLGDIEVRRYRTLAANRDQADPASGDVIISIEHRQFSNHNAGWIGFGPDGFLYIGTGDGGGAGDPNNNAQDLRTLLGKLLRIDVRTDAFPDDPSRDYAIPPDNNFVSTSFARPEVEAAGFRNPFRASFDGPDLYIGDVGQGAREEIDLYRKGLTGAYYGWPELEGTRPFRSGAAGGQTPPIAEYEHGTGPFNGRSVTGGYVYRGPSESLQALYIFGDFVSGNIWSIPIASFTAGGTVGPSGFTRRNDDFRPDAGAFNNIVSFGEDQARNLYIVDFDGEIFMIRAES